ncbi:MAG TPA: twin-arginine translocase subunit TatC [Streptosporangiaceae bacterium]|nr:twin-arginine translocase subunit TatC [Streptosporangiaceae bacterium]
MSTPPDPAAPARTRSMRMPRPGRSSNPDGRMSIIEHIRELRNRLIKAILGLAAGMLVGWFIFNRVWTWLERPYCKIPQRNQFLGTNLHVHNCALVVNGLFDGFFLHLKVAFVVGLIISSPIWLYQLWAFVAPGLYSREKRWTYAFVGTAVPLFALGGGFAYLAMSRGLRFLLGMVPHGAVPLITVDTYLGYATAMLLIFGLAFELPLILVILNLARVLTHERIRKWRRYMIFGVFLFAAVATPSPDPFTMLLLAVPCVVLVELAEVFAWLNDRRVARRPSMYEGLADDELAPVDFGDSGMGDSVDAENRT